MEEENGVCEECGLKECRGSKGYECEYLNTEDLI